MTGASFTIAKEVRSEFGNEFVILFGAEVLFSNKDETIGNKLYLILISYGLNSKYYYINLLPFQHHLKCNFISTSQKKKPRKKSFFFLLYKVFFFSRRRRRREKMKNAAI